MCKIQVRGQSYQMRRNMFFSKMRGADLPGLGADLPGLGADLPGRWFLNMAFVIFSHVRCGLLKWVMWIMWCSFRIETTHMSGVVWFGTQSTHMSGVVFGFGIKTTHMNSVAWFGAQSTHMSLVVWFRTQSTHMSGVAFGFWNTNHSYLMSIVVDLGHNPLIWVVRFGLGSNPLIWVVLFFDRDQLYERGGFGIEATHMNGAAWFGARKFLIWHYE